MKFYLGTDMPHWLRICGFPLFVSVNRLKKYKKLPIALDSWALDSGGFTQLSLKGKWDLSPKQYCDYVDRYYKEIGKLDFVAIQDWMCEPFILAKTGKTIKEHQEFTINSFLELKSINDKLPFIPILQGWEMSDYLNCVDMYLDKNIDLASFKTVGIGSVCRRQNTDEASDIIRRLSSQNIKLHGFGFKTLGLKKVSKYISSSDSMAWCISGWREGSQNRKICPEGKKNCAHCLHYAIEWRNNVLKSIEEGYSAN